MGCFADREKGPVAVEEKWDYVVRLDTNELIA